MGYTFREYPWRLLGHAGRTAVPGLPPVGSERSQSAIFPLCVAHAGSPALAVKSVCSPTIALSAQGNHGEAGATGAAMWAWCGGSSRSTPVLKPALPLAYRPIHHERGRAPMSRRGLPRCCALSLEIGLCPTLSGKLLCPNLSCGDCSRGVRGAGKQTAPSGCSLPLEKSRWAVGFSVQGEASILDFCPSSNDNSPACSPHGRLLSRGTVQSSVARTVQFEASKHSCASSRSVPADSGSVRPRHKGFAGGAFQA
jgi:hypothetical protein